MSEHLGISCLCNVGKTGCWDTPGLAIDGDWGSVVGVRVAGVIRSGNGVVAHSDGGEDSLDNWGNGGVCVSFDGGVGKVAAQAVGADDGAIVSRGADQGGGGDVESVGGGQANQEDGNLIINEEINIKLELYHDTLRIWNCESINLRLAC